MVGWYDNSKDGTVDQYISRCVDEGISPRFKGYSQFNDLAFSRHIIPGTTSIRVLYPKGFDEFYDVVKGSKLEGVAVNTKPRERKVHEPEDVLSNKVFEVLVR